MPPHPSEIPLRRTRIVATVGPASWTPAVLEGLLSVGVDVVRLNFSHGDHDIYRQVIQQVREISSRMGRPVIILQDLQGPKLRIGRLSGNRVQLRKGDEVILTHEIEEGDAHTLPVPFPEVLWDLTPGVRILLKDGQVVLRVREVRASDVVATVETGGEIASRAGLDLEGVDPPIPPLTPKDLEDLRFGVAMGVDWVAMSFVRRREDIRLLREELARLGASGIRVMAKIERPGAVARFQDILEEADGVMVARGDLGVALPLHEIPLVQKRLIRQAREAGKPVITATQMLESMLHSPTPTRAEVTDVANAIFDGSDGVMLSAETAVGDYPVEAVSVVDRIARTVESSPEFQESLVSRRPAPLPIPQDAVAYGAVDIAEALPADLIVVFTASGATAQRVARFRPRVPVLALTPDERVARQVTMFFGVHSAIAPTPASTDDMVALALRKAVEVGFARPGSRVVIVAGVPFGQRGSTNLIRLARVPGMLAPADE